MNDKSVSYKIKIVSQAKNSSSDIVERHDKVLFNYSELWKVFETLLICIRY